MRDRDYVLQEIRDHMLQASSDASKKQLQGSNINSRLGRLMP